MAFFEKYFGQPWAKTIMSYNKSCKKTIVLFLSSGHFDKSKKTDLNKLLTTLVKVMSYSSLDWVCKQKEKSKHTNEIMFGDDTSDCMFLSTSTGQQMHWPFIFKNSTIKTINKSPQKPEDAPQTLHECFFNYL